jgi:uncharacterized coiled-coil DUF342 family protein
VTGWRDIAQDQNLRIAQKMLEQQGEINRLKARIAELEAQREPALIEQINQLSAQIERLGAHPGCANYDGMEACPWCRIAELEQQVYELLDGEPSGEKE